MNRSIAFAWVFLVGVLASAQVPPIPMGVAGGGSGSGGISEGAALTGGTASRLIHTDVSGDISTATPALGAALTLTGALSGTSSNFTGQMVFSGVTTDISTGTNENLALAPNGSGVVEVAKTSESGVAEVFQRWTLSDVTTTKFHMRTGNATSSAATYVADIRGFSNSTASNVPGFQILGSVPNSADLVTNPGITMTNCITSTDGATGSLAAPTARPCHSFRGLSTDRAHVGWGGAWIDEPQTLTVADNGGGTAATGTLNPSAGFHRCTCNDSNGCTITVGETAVRGGQSLTVECTTANACNFADTAGVTELAGAFACSTNDTIELRYNGSAWVETGRSDN